MKLSGTNISALYGPAMQMVEQAEADQYFELLVAYRMGALAQKRFEGDIRAEAVKITLHNLGYAAGYYGAEAQKNVERLFGAKHPVFGG